MLNLRQWVSELRSSLWFIPMLIVMGAILLAVVMIWVDGRVSSEALERFPFLFGADAEGEREMLAAIAMSMITVAGVTFSITMVAVSQSANQYTSRVLGNFMRDRSNQTVLGVFVGVFAYCLVVIRTIRGDEDIRFVPSISVVVAFALALVAMGFLIYFIHHVARSLQSSTVLARLREDTEAAVDLLFPEEMGEEIGPEELERARGARSLDRWTPVPSKRTGYIQGVAEDQILELAADAKCVVRMDRAIGEFVTEGEPLASFSGRAPTGEQQKKLRGAYSIGQNRSVDQDPAYGIRQMVDVALMALSPAKNNTTTAIRCVDEISSVLCRLGPRRIESRLRGQNDEPHVLARGTHFAALLDAGFDEIRRSAAGNISILERMLSALERIAAFTPSPNRRALLLGHVDGIEEVATRTIPAVAERERLVRRCAEARLVVDRIGIEPSRWSAARGRGRRGPRLTGGRGHGQPS